MKLIARKEYKCDACQLQIRKGDEYVRYYEDDADIVRSRINGPYCKLHVVCANLLDNGNGVGDPSEDLYNAVSFVTHTESLDFDFSNDFAFKALLDDHPLPVEGLAERRDAFIKWRDFYLKRFAEAVAKVLL